MNICEHLSRPAKIFPHQPAIIFESHAVTYQQLNEQSIAAAQRLESIGVGPGDRVAIMLPNVPAFAVWYYGALRLGAIAVSLSTRLAKSEVTFVVEDCNAKVLILCSESDQTEQHTDDIEHVLEVDELGHSCGGQPLETDSSSTHTPYPALPNDPALILYTSGTTGFPKGATLSHNNVSSNVCAFNHLCDMSDPDVILLTVPLLHWRNVGVATKV